MTEHGRVEADIARKAQKVRGVERALMSEDGVMHFPEAVLRCRGFRSFGGDFGVRMNFGQREIAEYEPQLVAELVPQFLDDRKGGSAVRAFEVAVFNQCDER
jgi:hypothetical protein